MDLTEAQWNALCKLAATGAAGMDTLDIRMTPPLVHDSAVEAFIHLGLAEAFWLNRTLQFWVRVTPTGFAHYQHHYDQYRALCPTVVALPLNTIL